MAYKKMKKTTTSLLHVAAYIRVSTDAQAKKGDSLNEQHATLTEYIETHDNMVLHDIYVDDGVSGQKLKRGDFSRLMDDVRAGHIDFIIFTKLDRWFRSLRHYLNTQAALEEHGVNWLAVSQPYYDTSTPQGRAFIAQSMTFAELEAQNDSERILSVFDYKYKNGEVLSGSCPLGFSIVNKHLQPNEDAGKALETFRFYDRVGSINATVLFLEKEYGIIMSQINLKRAILTNKKYIGVFRDNTNYCPAIVPRELFDSVQRKLKCNVKCSQKYSYVFSGLVFCALCGHAMSGAQSTQRRGEKVYKYPTYRCRGAFPTHRCEHRKILSEHVLERYLLQNIKHLLSQYIVDYEVKNTPAADNRQKRAALFAKIDKLKELYVNDLITLDEFKKDKASYMEQISALPENTETKKDLSVMRSFLEMDLEAIYNDLAPEEKRYLWRSIIKEIRVDNCHNYTIIFL